MGDRELIEALGHTALLEGVERSDLEAIAAAARMRRLGRGDILFLEGEEARCLYLIRSGRVKIFKVSYAGKEQILHVLGPSSTVAEAAAFAGGRYPASAEALEPAVLLEIDGARFTAFIRARPRIALRIIAGLCAKLREFNARIEDLSLKDVTARLARYIVDRARQEGSERVCRLEIPKNQLAAEIGTIAETLSRTLARLKARGWIEERPGAIVLADPRRLGDLAAGLPPEDAGRDGP